MTGPRALALATLLAGCSNGDVIATTSQTISASDGGTLELDGVTLDIPAGALPEDVEITLTVMESSDEYPAMEGMSGPIYSLEPDGIQFEMPVELTLPVPEGMETEGSHMVLWDEEEGWEVSELQLSGEGEVHALLNHFSVRALQNNRLDDPIFAGVCLAEGSFDGFIADDVSDQACESLGCLPTGTVFLQGNGASSYAIIEQMFDLSDWCGGEDSFLATSCSSCPDGVRPEDIGYALQSELTEYGYDACPDNDALELENGVCGCSETGVPVDVNGESICDECPDNDDALAPDAICGCDPGVTTQVNGEDVCDECPDNASKLEPTEACGCDVEYFVDGQDTCGAGCGEGFVINGIQQLTPAGDNPNSCPEADLDFLNALDDDASSCTTWEVGDGQPDTCTMAQSCIVDPSEDGRYYEEVLFDGTFDEDGFSGFVTQRFISNGAVLEGFDCTWQVTTQEQVEPTTFDGTELEALQSAVFLEHTEAFVNQFSISTGDYGPNTADLYASSYFTTGSRSEWSPDVTYTFEAPHTFNFVDSTGPFTFSCDYCERGSRIRDCEAQGFSISESFYGHGLICDLSTAGEALGEDWRGEVRFFR